MTLGQIASVMPRCIPALERMGLDYCCGGARTLADVCSVQSMDLERTLRALEASLAAEPIGDGESDWTAASMSELADHIESTHHAFVRDAMARLGKLVPRVVAAHAQREPRLARLSEVVRSFAEDMHEHMIREERVLFPWLRRLERPSQIHTGPPWSVRRPIACMVHDHDEASTALKEMRTLTDGFAAPEGACMSYSSMLRLLNELELDTHVHIHKENNILFPAGVIAETRRLSGD